MQYAVRAAFVIGCPPLLMRVHSARRRARTSLGELNVVPVAALEKCVKDRSLRLMLSEHSPEPDENIHGIFGEK